MVNHNSVEQSKATAGSDAPARQHAVGDRTSQTFNAQVNHARSEPGQGLAAHNERMRATDVTSMGFPQMQIVDSSKSLNSGQGGQGSQSDQGLLQEAAYRKGPDSNSHACHVNPGKKPFQSGIASIYSEREKTAIPGERNDPAKHTAASKELPLNSTACVTRPGSNEGTEVRINDRGPYIKGRVLDMTPASARDIGVDGLGQVNVWRPGQYTRD